jgi:hypothetical protein
MYACTSPKTRLPDQPRLEEQLQLDDLEKRIANFIRLRGGNVSSTQVWNAFSKDRDAAAVIKQHGGTSAFCQLFSETFQVGSNSITLLTDSMSVTDVSTSGSRLGKRTRAVDSGDDLNLVWRIANFLKKRRGKCTNDELWDCFGSDDQVRPFLIRHGGTRTFLRQHPNIFVLDNDMVALARGADSHLRRNSESGPQHASSAASHIDEGHLVWRIQNFIQKRGGSCTSDELWDTFSNDDDVRRYLIAQGGSRTFLKHHPEAFSVENGSIYVVGDVGSDPAGSQAPLPRLDTSHLLWRIKNFILRRGGSCTNQVIVDVSKFFGFCGSC